MTPFILFVFSSMGIVLFAQLYTHVGVLNLCITLVHRILAGTGYNNP